MPAATIRVRVPFVDVDSTQRIHYTAWLRFMEVAEHHLMREIGYSYATVLRDQAYPRVRLECDFRGAIQYDDELDVEARIERVGRSSWTVAFVGRHARSASRRGAGRHRQDDDRVHGPRDAALPPAARRSARRARRRSPRLKHSRGALTEPCLGGTMQENAQEEPPWPQASR